MVTVLLFGSPVLFAAVVGVQNRTPPRAIKAVPIDQIGVRETEPEQDSSSGNQCSAHFTDFTD